jgi:hypothetical protein
MNTTGRFLSMDPLAEKYYHLSPYAYCAGDPVNFVDPDGREWKTEKDKNKANKIKTTAENKLKRIQKKIIKSQEKLNKKPSSKKRQSKLNVLKQQEKLIMSFIDGIDKLTISSNVYTFIDLGSNNSTNPNMSYQTPDNKNKKNGYLKKNNLGEVEINYISNYSNIYHETQHAIQYELGEFGINGDCYSNTKRELIWGFEEDAYKVEYLLGKLFKLRSGVWIYNSINTEWIKSLGY